MENDNKFFRERIFNLTVYTDGVCEVGYDDGKISREEIQVLLEEISKDYPKHIKSLDK